MGKPILKLIRPNLAILANKNFQKPLRWPYLKTRFLHSASHVWSNNLGNDLYISMILFAAAAQLTFLLKNEARFFI